MSATLLHMQQPNHPKLVPAKPQWQALFAMGFRPLYILGSLWSIVALGIWVFAPALLENSILIGFAWHAHEMLWGFIATIAVGFLYTASTNWTGTNPLHGNLLAGQCALWLVARIAYLVPGASAFVLAIICELTFYAIAIIVVLRVVIKSQSYHNIGLPLAVLGLSLANVGFLYYAYCLDLDNLMRYFQLGMLCMASIALLIGRRVIPFFTMRAINGLQIPRHTKLGQCQLAIAIIGIVLLLANYSVIASCFIGISAIIALYQLYSWRPLRVLKVPLLWILYCGYVALSLGLLSYSGHLLYVNYVEQLSWIEYFSWLERPAWPIHLIAVGGFACLIIGIMVRSSLGHLGRALVINKGMLTSFIFIILAALCRMVSLSSATLALPFLHTAALFWVLGFAIYLWQFVPMLIRPRLDASSTIKANIILKQ